MDIEFPAPATVLYDASSVGLSPRSSMMGGLHALLPPPLLLEFLVRLPTPTAVIGPIRAAAWAVAPPVVAAVPCGHPSTIPGP